MRQEARALGLDQRARCIEMGGFPANLNEFAPHEVEDCPAFSSASPPRQPPAEGAVRARPGGRLLAAIGLSGRSSIENAATVSPEIALKCSRTLSRYERRSYCRISIGDVQRGSAANFRLGHVAMCSASENSKYLLDLKRKFRALGDRIEAGDESQLLIWVIPSKLACSHRPLRHNRLYGGSIRNLDAGASSLVMRWVDRIVEEGIRSVICLMSDQEVQLYSQLELGASNLLELYRKRGLEVASIPWKDPRHVRRDLIKLRQKEAKVSADALREFDNLTKPVLLHCSAGIDRSSPVAAFIRERRS